MEIKVGDKFYKHGFYIMFIESIHALHYGITIKYKKTLIRHEEIRITDFEKALIEQNFEYIEDDSNCVFINNKVVIREVREIENDPIFNWAFISDDYCFKAKIGSVYSDSDYQYELRRQTPKYDYSWDLLNRVKVYRKRSRFSDFSCLYGPDRLVMMSDVEAFQYKLKD